MSARQAGMALAIVTLAMVGCALGPNYQRPTVPMTETFRGQAVAQAESFADLPWWEVYRDPAPSEEALRGWNYRAIRHFGPGQYLTPLAAPDRTIAVVDLLP